MATAADVDMRSWTVQSSSPIRTGIYPNSVRPGVSFSEIARGANRTTGVAPLGVMFTAGFDSSDGTNNNFHELHYEWDFDDVGSGTWGTNGKSKNSDTGPVVGHVFESAGTYNVGLTVRDPATGTVLDTDTITVTVTDPDTVFSGTNTVVINNVGDNDFTGAPAGATQVNSDDLVTTIPLHFASGKRILLKRGGTWATTGTVPVTNQQTTAHIGAYGTGTGADSQGLFSNAPQVNHSGTSGLFTCDRQSDVRITDISCSVSNTDGSLIGGGNRNIRNVLIFNCKSSGGGTGVGWSDYRATTADWHDGNMIVNNSLSGTRLMPIFASGERMAIIGNKGFDSSDSHICRVTHCTIGRISNNEFTGADITSGTGRHAIKLHGPKEGQYGDTPTLKGVRDRTKFVVVSSNNVGASGPWPVSIGPQDSISDERLTDIVIEKNKLLEDLGTQNTGVQACVQVWARFVAVRNNVLMGAGNSPGFTGVSISQRGIEPAPSYVWAYNNTIYHSGNPSSSCTGISVGGTATNIIARNNAASFPNFTGTPLMITGAPTESNNTESDTLNLVDPINVAPLSRDFTPNTGSVLIGAGVSVPVYDDLNGTTRAGDDIGAMEVT